MGHLETFPRLVLSFDRDFNEVILKTIIIVYPRWFLDLRCLGIRVLAFFGVVSAEETNYKMLADFAPSLSLLNSARSALIVAFPPAPRSPRLPS